MPVTTSELEAQVNALAARQLTMQSQVSSLNSRLDALSRTCDDLRSQGWTQLYVVRKLESEVHALRTENVEYRRLLEEIGRMHSV